MCAVMLSLGRHSVPTSSRMSQIAAVVVIYLKNSISSSHHANIIIIISESAELEKRDPNLAHDRERHNRSNQNKPPSPDSFPHWSDSVPIPWLLALAGPTRSIPRGCGRGKEDSQEWIPVTKLGRLVRDGKIRTLEEIYLYSLPILSR
ncbi:ribosomal protein S2 [Culex quinquefasciatus]|uniref:Ribosomal protein S2 n=1 Tax=Culex quinquefasciatus TaxID=7176 RepID=B0WDW1_CULQU|nr:ribosomal protein S2 [Culex quinquefasciatus]|eukprot:XP_001846895.1 ribosomal protein S2 [Culex quinquefasciatus]